MHVCRDERYPERQLRCCKRAGRVQGIAGREEVNNECTAEAASPLIPSTNVPSVSCDTKMPQSLKRSLSKAKCTFLHLPKDAYVVCLCGHTHHDTHVEMRGQCA